MRKTILSLAFLVSLAACANNNAQQAANENTNTVAQTETVATAEDNVKMFVSHDITMANGDVVDAKTLLNEGGYTLVDTWASWCGPCRKAVPVVKEMAKNYAEILKVVSISCDKDEQAWRKALAEENMPWPQAILAGAQRQAFMEEYGIQFIPYLMLVKDGKIVVATNDTTEVEAFLKAL